MGGTGRHPPLTPPSPIGTSDPFPGNRPPVRSSTPPPASAPVPLSRTQSRRFVLLFVAMIVGLAVLATILITQGWADETLQGQVSEIEEERRSQMPRLND